MAVKKIEDTGIYQRVVSPAVKGGLIFIIIAGVLMVLAFYVWYRNYIIKLANEVHMLRKEATDPQIRKDHHLAVIIKKESYPKILKFAREKLGLMPAVEKPIEFKVSLKEYKALHR